MLMYRKFKERRSTIPPRSTKPTTTSDLKPLNTKTPRHMVLKMHVLAWDSNKMWRG